MNRGHKIESGETPAVGIGRGTGMTLRELKKKLSDYVKRKGLSRAWRRSERKPPTEKPTQRRD